MIEAMKFTLLLLCTTMTTITAIVLYDTFSGRECFNKAIDMGVIPQYNISTGCKVLVRDEFVRIERVAMISLNGQMIPVVKF